VTGTALIPEGIVFRGCEVTAPCESIKIEKAFTPSDKAFTFKVNGSSETSFQPTKLIVNYEAGEIEYMGYVTFPQRPAGTTAPFVTSITVELLGQDNTPAFDLDRTTVGFFIPASETTEWVILHYALNGIAYENVPMVLNGSYYSYKVEGLEKGAVLDFFTTVFDAGYAHDSDVITHTKQNLYPYPSGPAKLFTSGFYINTNVSIEWANINFSVNGGEMQSVELVNSDVSVWTAPFELPVDAEIDYSFTYSINGTEGQTETYTNVVVETP